MLNLINQFLKGLFIGSAAILPGVSSGVLCIAFGLYEKLVNSILGFFSNIKENIKFLFPIFLGVSIGVILFSNILNYLFIYFEVPVCFLFIGLVFGSIPSVIKEGNIKKIKPSYILAMLLTFSFSIYLVAIGSTFNTYSFSSSGFYCLIFAGFAMSAGVVIPGVSSTVILMLLGKYEQYLIGLSSLDFSILIPMGIGLLIGSFLLMYVIKSLFSHLRVFTYFLIIGFVLGSIPILVPDISSFSSLIYGIFAFLLGISVSLIFYKLK